MQIIKKSLNANTHNRTQRNIANIKYIVVHHTGGGEGGLIPTLNNRGLSYHFAIRPNGQVLQFVDILHTAWHARHLNATSIGIAFIGNMTGQEPTVEAYNACVDLIRQLHMTDREIVGHGQRMATACPASVNVQLIADRTSCKLNTDIVIEDECLATCENQELPEPHAQKIDYDGVTYTITAVNRNGSNWTTISELSPIFGSREVGIRALLEMAGYTVDWNQETGTILVN